MAALFVSVRSQSPSEHEHVFGGLGIKLFDGLPAIPTCCRASGNGKDTVKGFLCDARITGYALWIEGAAPRDSRPWDGGLDPLRAVATGCYLAGDLRRAATHRPTRDSPLAVGFLGAKPDKDDSW